MKAKARPSIARSRARASDRAARISSRFCEVSGNAVVMVTSSPVVGEADQGQGWSSRQGPSFALPGSRAGEGVEQDLEAEAEQVVVVARLEPRPDRRDAGEARAQRGRLEIAGGLERELVERDAAAVGADGAVEGGDRGVGQPLAARQREELVEEGVGALGGEAPRGQEREGARVLVGEPAV